jgi:DnaK suppressor protein
MNSMPNLTGRAPDHEEHVAFGDSGIPENLRKKPAKRQTTAVPSAPAGAYMNGDQLAFFRDRLLAERLQLERNLSDTTDFMKEAGQEADSADVASRQEEQTIKLRIRGREINLMQKIDGALTRIDEGTYGYCEETGEPIGIARLVARPVATLTIEAQERRERRKRGGAV